MGAESHALYICVHRSLLDNAKDHKNTHEEDNQIFRSILGTTSPLSKPLLKLLIIYETL